MREKEFLPLVSERLGIKELNDMQRKMLEAVTQSGDIILLSPTGSGKTLLTSATHTDMLPEFLKLKSPRTFSYLEDNKQLRSRIRVHRVESGGKDKLQTLLALLYNMAGGSSLGKTIIFVNHRESAERVAKFLRNSGASAVLYHGALDQREREKALALFRNESRPVLVSTDLGARGLDIEGVEHVVHYHIPISSEAYTHRNGRTARVDRDGQVFVIVGPEEDLPDFVTIDDNYHIDAGVTANLASGYDTVYIGAGKKEKLSKGDILGWLTKNCSVDGKSVGRIDVADHYSLVSLPVDVAADILKEGRNNQRIKGQKQRVELVR